MGFIKRTFQRLLSFLLSAALIWLMVEQVFDRLEQRLPAYLALILTYIISAYFILPQIIFFGNMVLRRGRIPRVTRASDGLSADPVNIILVGTKEDLISAFKAIGWHKADDITIRSSWKMIKSLILNKPYPTAPFSSFYLFGRKQDIGFQEIIGNSPRKRHHIRFWAANIDPRKEISDLVYWLKKHPVDLSDSNFWVGAASEDLGLGLTKLTYQFTHRTNDEVDKERDYIINCLRQGGYIKGENYIEAGGLVAGKYISDGRILWAEVISPS